MDFLQQNGVTVLEQVKRLGTEVMEELELILTLEPF